MVWIKNNHDQCISHNVMVPVNWPELVSGRNFPLGKTGKGSQAFWEQGKGSWVWFLHSSGSYPSSSGNDALTIPSYTGNFFSPFSAFPEIFSVFGPFSGSSPHVRRCFVGCIVYAVRMVESTYVTSYKLSTNKAVICDGHDGTPCLYKPFSFLCLSEC